VSAPASPGVRELRAAATREQLIRAGLRLAERTGLAGMSVNLIVAEAGVAKGTFFHHFKDRAEYVLVLHQAFHDDVFDGIVRVIGGMPPGKGRLLAAANAYLDDCLRHRGVRAMLLEARSDPAIIKEIGIRNQQVAECISADFAALGWEDPAAGAAMWCGAVVEAAILELAAGECQPGTRAALARFLPVPRPG
jgi:TetR/AcrR family transcriptional regulator, transcriptional repressor for nem operon